MLRKLCFALPVFACLCAFCGISGASFVVDDLVGTVVVEDDENQPENQPDVFGGSVDP